MTIDYNINTNLIQSIELIGSEIDDFPENFDIYLEIIFKKRCSIFEDDVLIIPWYYIKEIEWDKLIRQKKVVTSHLLDKITDAWFAEARKPIMRFLESTSGKAHEYFKNEFKDILALYELIDNKKITRGMLDIIYNNSGNIEDEIDANE